VIVVERFGHRAVIPDDQIPTLRLLEDVEELLFHGGDPIAYAVSVKLLRDWILSWPAGAA
jgi:hypothetical protein